jgi:hypothetical protein
MLHVVLKEVPLEVKMFDLLVDQAVMRISEYASVILSYGGCSVDGFVEDLPHKLAMEEALLSGVCCKVLLFVLHYRQFIPRKWIGRRMSVV